MATTLSSRNISRPQEPDPSPVARWLDEKGAPLLLAAVLALVALAASDLGPAGSAGGHPGRQFHAE